MPIDNNSAGAANCCSVNKDALSKSTFMLPHGFVYLDQAVPGVICDAKYAGDDNFIGRPVAGYLASRVVGTLELGEALVDVSRRAAALDLRLVLWDAYRPCRAVAHFIRWTNSPEDYKTKEKHYPRIDKTQLIELGYIASRSGHSRGGTIDLTLAMPDGTPLDMGGIFDLMDEQSHHGWPGCSEAQKNNRLLLKNLMEQAGFSAYSAEWWHYRLAKEPYPDTYFDFAIT